MYIPTGNYYTDVVTDYFKIIPGVLVVSRSNSIMSEHDNNHKTYRTVASHWTVHFLWVFSLSFTWRTERTVNNIHNT